MGHVFTAVVVRGNPIEGDVEEILVPLRAYVAESSKKLMEDIVDLEGLLRDELPDELNIEHDNQIVNVKLRSMGSITGHNIHIIVREY